MADALLARAQDLLAEEAVGVHEAAAGRAAVQRLGHVRQTRL